MSFKIMAEVTKIKVGNSSTKLVLLMLADRSNEDGLSFPSLTRIAEDCEMSKPTVIKHIKKLEDMGIIEVIHRVADVVSLPNYYKINLDYIKNETKNEDANLGGVVKNFNGGSKETLRGVVKNFNGGSKETLLGVVKNFNTNLSIEPINEPKENNKKKISRLVNRIKALGVDDIIPFIENERFIQLFEEWWNDVRKHKKASDRDVALKRAINKILKISSGKINVAIRILEKSCDNGWSDVYPLRPQEYAEIVNKKESFKQQAKNPLEHLNIPKEELATEEDLKEINNIMLSGLKGV